MAFVVTLPAVKPDAVPVMLVPTRAEGVPKAGVTKVGEVANTNEPEPVSSVTADAKLAEDGAPRNVATPEPSPSTPVLIGNPVPFVKTMAVGVPSAGVTNVGDVDSTTLPVPVDVVVPVPPLSTGSVPVTCEARFTPVRAPPKVRLPVEVTVPVRVMPLTVPVPLTLVTPSATLVAIFTKSEPFHAISAFSPLTIVTPVVGPAPTT